MAARLTIDLPAWVEAATADGQTFRDDHDKMALVIRLAEENATRGEGGPFGTPSFFALMFAQQRVGSFTLCPPPAGPATSWSPAASRARCAWARRSGAGSAAW
jgi:hypothetical protein